MSKKDGMGLIIELGGPPPKKKKGKSDDEYDNMEEMGSEWDEEGEMQQQAADDVISSINAGDAEGLVENLRILLDLI